MFLIQIVVQNSISPNANSAALPGSGTVAGATLMMPGLNTIDHWSAFGVDGSMLKYGSMAALEFVGGNDTEALEPTIAETSKFTVMTAPLAEASE
jgi:hypothetical protein